MELCIQSQFEFHSRTLYPQTKSWEHGAVVEHFSGVHKALNSIPSAYKYTIMDESYIISGMAEVEGEYNQGRPVRDVTLE